MAKVWLVYWLTDPNDPAPDCLGAWSTQELAEQERARLLALEATKPEWRRQRPDLIEIIEASLDEPWPHRDPQNTRDGE